MLIPESFALLSRVARHFGLFTRSLSLSLPPVFLPPPPSLHTITSLSFYIADTPSHSVPKANGKSTKQCCPVAPLSPPLPPHYSPHNPDTCQNSRHSLGPSNIRNILIHLPVNHQHQSTPTTRHTAPILSTCPPTDPHTHRPSRTAIPSGSPVLSPTKVARPKDTPELALLAAAVKQVALEQSLPSLPSSLLPRMSWSRMPRTYCGRPLLLLNRILEIRGESRACRVSLHTH